MLKTRIKTGAVLTAIVILSLYFSYLPFALSFLAALISTLGTHELFHAAKCNGEKAQLIVGLILSFTIPFVLPFLPKSIFVVGLAFVFFLAHSVYLMFHIDQLKFNNCGIALGYSIIIAVLYSSIPMLRKIENGLYYVCIVILSSVITEITAYLIGRSFGKHKLAPKVSPGKTIEGCIGGTVIAVGINFLLIILTSLKLNISVQYISMVGYLILASFIGQVGDLSMSLVKRSAGIKDFSKIMPGHGGILDRFDSQLFIAPFTLVFCTFIPLFLN